MIGIYLTTYNGIITHQPPSSNIYKKKNYNIIFYPSKCKEFMSIFIKMNLITLIILFFIHQDARNFMLIFYETHLTKTFSYS